MENMIVFDIETQKTFDEVGGYENREKLGVSYVGLYSYSQQKLFGFFEQDLPMLEKILLAEKPMLIGFNSIHFDVPVLQPYFTKLDLSTLPHLDILKEVEKDLGHRLKLDSIAQATIYHGKSGDGLDAIRWYRSGDFESLAKYCLGDVEVTRDIYEYGQRHGKLYYMSGGEKRPITIPWGVSPTIINQVRKAFQQHKQLTIEYFQVDENGVKTIVPFTIEILSLNPDGQRFDAYCHELNTKKTFIISDIWTVESTGKTFAHQASLF